MSVLVLWVVYLASTGSLVAQAGVEKFRTRIDRDRACIWVDASVDGQPIRLLLDTAATASVLRRDTCRRLGIEVSGLEGGPDPSSDGLVAVARSAPCRVDLGAWTFEAFQWCVHRAPTLHREADGVLGWDVLRKRRFAIDWDAGCVRLLTELPTGLEDWTVWDLRRTDWALIVEVADHGAAFSMLLDTGSDSGLDLPRSEWEARAAREDARTWTVVGSYSPGRGFSAEYERWAQGFGLGSFTVPGLPLCATSHAMMKTLELDANMGMVALSSFDFIVDGPNGRVYCRLRDAAALPWRYNRLGAAFVPSHSTSTDLVAKVAPDSPAAEAGIADGDLLLRIGDLDVTA